MEYVPVLLHLFTFFLLLTCRLLYPLLYVLGTDLSSLLPDLCAGVIGVLEDYYEDSICMLKGKRMYLLVVFGYCVLISRTCSLTFSQVLSNVSLLKVST